MSGFPDGSSSGTIRVLHVDDNPDLADLTATFLERESDDFDVVQEHDPLQALDRLETDFESVDCIVSDYDMPEMNGLEFLEAVREAHSDLPVILFTGKGSEEIASEAISRGITDYLQKGTSMDQYTVLANRIQNATAQHRAEREIERRSEWYQRILAYSSDYVLIVNDMGKVSYVSPSIERVMGYTPEETIGNDSFEYILPEDQIEAMNSFAKTIENPDEEVTVEFRGEHKDGSIRWLEVRGRNFFDDPIINGVMVNIRDITARKEREQELKERNDQLEEVTSQLQDQYQHLFEQLPIMAVVTREEDGTPIIEDCNNRFIQTLGYDEDEILDRPLGEFYTPESRTKMIDREGNSCSLNGEFIREARELVTKDEEIVETILRQIPRHSNAKEPGGTLALYINITEREEVKREKERLQEVLNIVSHDLRNPLNVARGRLDLVQEDCDSEHLVAIEQTHERMNALIDDLLLLGWSGKQVDDLKPIKLSELSERCWQNVVTEDTSIIVESDRTLQGDHKRLQQLFENLFRNAVEHGSTSSRPGADTAADPAGEGVTVAVGSLDDGFYVEDDGPGIPEETREKIFESGYSTKEGGTGFGLAIVEQIVDAHGWDITITESDTGGTRFEITGIDKTA